MLVIRSKEHISFGRWINKSWLTRFDSKRYFLLSSNSFTGVSSVSPGTTRSSSLARGRFQGNRYLGFSHVFCILMNFYFDMYYIFSHTDPYEHVGKRQKKNRKENWKYIHRRLTHNYILIKRKKETHPGTFFSIYMKKLIKINNKWSKRRKDRIVIRFIFAPFFETKWVCGASAPSRVGEDLLQVFFACGEIHVGPNHPRRWSLLSKQTHDNSTLVLKEALNQGYAVEMLTSR